MYISWSMFYGLCEQLSKKINREKYSNLYPVMKNGLPVAERLSGYIDLPISYQLKKNSLVVDDLIDSGKTLDQFPDNDKAVLFVKNDNENKINYFVKVLNEWITFPWEKEEDIYNSIIRMIEYIGEDPTREGLIDTPKRIVNSWKELYSGYRTDPNDTMKMFQEGVCDEMIILKNINFFSVCEHHLLPFFGKCFIGYVPDKKVIGLSKLARLVEVFARRMQIQERMTTQIANCLMNYGNPKGVMVLVEAKHLCMISRGIKSQDAEMTTSAIRGIFEEQAVRQEFLNLIRGK